MSRQRAPSGDAEYRPRKDNSLVTDRTYSGSESRATSEGKQRSARSNSVGAPRPQFNHNALPPQSTAECSPSQSASKPRNDGQPVPYESNYQIPKPVFQASSAHQGLATPLKPSEGCHRGHPLSDSPQVRALPGTMSTRQVVASRTSRRRQLQPKEQDQVIDDSDRRHDKLGDRVKSAFKGMFRRKSANESDFERIGESHWSDE